MCVIMFAIERIRIIKNYILENHQAEVSALSTMLNVSEVTIRRDLEKLEKEGFLTRTHGGSFNEEEEEDFLDMIDGDRQIIMKFLILRYK